MGDGVKRGSGVCGKALARWTQCYAGGYVGVRKNFIHDMPVGGVGRHGFPPFLASVVGVATSLSLYLR